MQQEFTLKCQKHPKLSLETYINIKPTFQGQRFFCAQCMKEALQSGTSHEDFLTVHEVFVKYIELMDDSSTLLQSIHYQDSFFSQFIEYDYLLDKNIDEIIHKAKNDFCNSLEQLRQSLKPQIELFEQLKKEILISKENLNNVLGYENLKQSYLNFKINSKVRDSDEWIQVEQSLQNLINQVSKKQNDEFKVIQESLEHRSKLLISLDLNLSMFDNSIIETKNQFCKLLDKCLYFRSTINTDLCPKEFMEKLLLQTGVKRKGISTLYKYSPDTIDFEQLKQKINNQSQILYIIKTNSNQIFGAYTPTKWNCQVSSYFSDESLKSFIFSISKQQIYPLKQANKHNSIFNEKDHYIAFGGGHDLKIMPDFTIASNLGHSYNTNQYGAINGANHLSGGQNTIVRLEIYQIL